MFHLLSLAMYRSMSFELKCAVNSVALKLMLAPLVSYSHSAVLACQHGGVNRMGHVLCHYCDIFFHHYINEIA